MARKDTNNVNEINTVRDTLESIWIAIVLAFVLRAFMVEAFVIPTGSMAERLYGQHWTRDCPCCHWDFAFGINKSRADQWPMTTCPNCGHAWMINEKDGKTVAGSGDRVLVPKYIYHFTDPKPWDVVVFKKSAE